MVTFSWNQFRTNIAQACTLQQLPLLYRRRSQWPRPGKVTKTPVTAQAPQSFNDAASGAQAYSAGVLPSAGAAQLSAVTSPPDTYAASGGAPVNPFVYRTGALVSGVTVPIAEIGAAEASGTASGTPLGAEETREAAESYAPLAATAGPTSGAPPPPSNIAVSASAAATVGAAEGATSAAVEESAATAASPAAATPAAGMFVAGFVRPGAPRKAQSARRAKRPRKDSTPGNLAPAPDTSCFGTAFPPMPPFARFLSPGENGGAVFSPGLSFDGLMRQWNWLTGGVANASMAMSAGTNSGGGTTPLSLPLPSPFSGVFVQAVGSSPAAGPTMGLASLKDTSAAAAASTPGTLGLFPGHYTSPAIATTPRAFEGAVVQTQPDRASTEDNVSSSAVVYNGIGKPVSSLPPPLRADVLSSSSKEVATAALEEESSEAFWNLEQEASTPDSTKRSAEMHEEETFLATLVNSMDASNLKTLAVRRAMMSRLKNVGRAVAD